MQITTKDQYNRTLEALAETTGLLDRELSYSVRLQKADRIEFYTGHITKLVKMLNEYRAST